MKNEEHNLARHYFLQEENEKFLSELEKCESLTLEDVLMLSEVQIRLGMLFEAESNLNLLLKNNYELATVYFDLGNIYIKKRDFIKVREYYDLAIACGNQDTTLYCNYGMVAVYGFELQDAIKLYSKAEELDTENDVPVRELISLYLSEGDYEKALEKCNRLNSICPNDYEGYHKKFVILASSNRVDKAEEFLNTIKEPFLNNRDYLCDLIYLYQKKKEYKKGYHFVLSNIDVLGEDKIETKKYLAEFLMLMGKHDEAKNLFEKILDIDEEISALHSLMLYAFVEKKLELTIDYAERITKLDIRDMRYFNALYYMCLASKVCESNEVFRKRTEVALYLMQQDAICLPENIQAVLHRAILYHGIDMHEEALQDVNFVIDVLGEEPELTRVRDMITGVIT